LKESKMFLVTWTSQSQDGKYKKEEKSLETIFDLVQFMSGLFSQKPPILSYLVEVKLKDKNLGFGGWEPGPTENDPSEFIHHGPW